MISQCNLMISQYNLMVSQCNLMISQCNLMISQCNLMISQCNLMISQYNLTISQYNLMISQYNLISITSWSVSITSWSVSITSLSVSLTSRLCVSGGAVHRAREASGPAGQMPGHCVQGDAAVLAGWGRSPSHLPRTQPALPGGPAVRRRQRAGQAGQGVNWLVRVVAASVGLEYVEGLESGLFISK